MQAVAFNGYSEVYSKGFWIWILPYLGHSTAQVQLPLWKCPDSGQSDPKFLTHFPRSPAVQGNQGVCNILYYKQTPYLSKWTLYLLIPTKGRLIYKIINIKIK